MKNLNTPAKFKVTKTVVARFSKPQASNNFGGSTTTTVDTTTSILSTLIML
ncbi:hypothetical protein [Hymenobacter terrestris]|uniref:Uncharacterized protein n=1 Tax=Hymenobacter terrestris TaxID=2748310 RepID=A0ABX2Q4K3_9BACT|nr:hypothetical protein [Hymenobacter terrestris]NVO85882.1 hypothetical protein [Hymenobacter terrestris]